MIIIMKNVYYINLEERTDRKKQVEGELNKLGWEYERFNAIKNKNGRIGCSMSHLKLLQMAKEKDLEYVVIIEDDIQFLKPKYYSEKLQEYLEKSEDHDVFVIAGNLRRPIKKLDGQLYQIYTCWTTTGYIVKNHYYDKMIENIKEGIVNLMKEPEKHYLYAIDAYWQKLQKEGKWVMILPRTVTQRPDYSDIEGREINYNHLMVDIKT